LPADLCDRLDHEAQTSGRSPSWIAAQAVEDWIERRHRRPVAREVAEYAARAAGTSADHGLADAAAMLKQPSPPPALGWCRLWRGEVCRTNLEARPGAGLRGASLVVVVSSDGFNETETWRSVTVVPVATHEIALPGPTAIVLSGDVESGTASVALCHLVTTVGRHALTDRVGSLGREQLAQIDEGLKAALDLV
jgi:mRNA-degrading endonuclease toxin of MazEF toxin-antitoxin module